MGISSAPFVVGDLVITGSHIVDETGSKGPAGDVRAWDVRTGKLVWTFHSVPRPGETGHETWQDDQWKNQSGVNVWTFFTADTDARHPLHAASAPPITITTASTAKARICSPIP